MLLSWRSYRSYTLVDASPPLAAAASPRRPSITRSVTREENYYATEKRAHRTYIEKLSLSRVCIWMFIYGRETCYAHRGTVPCLALPTTRRPPPGLLHSARRLLVSSIRSLAGQHASQGNSRQASREPTPSVCPSNRTVLEKLEINYSVWFYLHYRNGFPARSPTERVIREKKSENELLRRYNLRSVVAGVTRGAICASPSINHLPREPLVLLRTDSSRGTRNYENWNSIKKRFNE